MKYKIGDSFILENDKKIEKITVIAIHNDLYYIKQGCCKRNLVSEETLNKLNQIIYKKEE